MLHFLRRIRRSLINTGATRKYLLYAVGEIMLVMIGILLALQVNNWNEDRKDRELEKSLLENLAENLEQNCERLKSRITSIIADRKYGDIILSAIENKSYHDSLETIFPKVLVNSSKLQLSQIGYEAIKNKGFEIIHNEALRIEIISFFEERRQIFNNELKRVDIDAAHREKYIDEQFVQRLSKGGGFRPFNPEKLMEENYFYALISKKDNQSFFFNLIMNNHLKKTESLLQNVMSELNDIN